MNTPVCDFVKEYAGGNPVRMHMPGHKGRGLPGPEALDITEIAGADELYRSRGILRESEENAAGLFGAARTVYSAEGSSLCIRGMLYLAMLTGKERGLPPRILAGRNAHRTLMTAAALLDLEIEWLMPETEGNILSCRMDRRMLERKLKEKKVMAVYLTSPDYLGFREDLRGAAEICRRYGVPLLVDNAHGAYLKFTEEDTHPMTLGADACCDSAHKTLRCLTGAAYLHISAGAPEGWAERAEEALSLFASTSPSWLILQSLDRMNAELAGDYPGRLRNAVKRLSGIRKELEADGWMLIGNEPMKLTLKAADRGYTGKELLGLLSRAGIECEFADREYLVLMPSADTEETEWEKLRAVLRSIPRKEPVRTAPPALLRPEKACSIREAMLAPRETVPAGQACGRILADACVSCPPAVPVMIAGERITEDAVKSMLYYGVTECAVVRE